MCEDKSSAKCCRNHNYNNIESGYYNDNAKV
jgi:hypothetical protein